MIYEYYGSKKLKEVIAAVIRYKQQSGKSARISGDEGIIERITNQNPHEQSMLFQNLPLVPMYTAAALKAHDWYGYSDDVPKNASKHGAWNALAIRAIILAGIFEDPATTYVRRGTSAHEMSDSGVWTKTFQNLVDLNSNIIGRTWMNAETGWGVFGIRKMPGDGKIKEVMDAKAATDCYIMTYDWHVLDRYAPGNPTFAWEMLYMHDNAANSYFMYILDPK